VISTLHTNDAPSAFTRLIDMGIEPFLVASSVEAVMAQRLIRTICPHCKVEHKVTREYLERIGFPEADIATAKVWRGAGCEECRQLGYQGRKGIYELLLVTEAVRPLILSRAPATTIAQRAMEAGMRTLRTDGWNKVKAGETTIEEIMRVTQIEEHIETLASLDKIPVLPKR
jgi:type II secretory ATPase GspE/PulE/Tfp pilus assembly ATPase PilB-like protein